ATAGGAGAAARAATSCATSRSQPPDGHQVQADGHHQPRVVLLRPVGDDHVRIGVQVHRLLCSDLVDDPVDRVRVVAGEEQSAVRLDRVPVLLLLGSGGGGHRPGVEAVQRDVPLGDQLGGFGGGVQRIAEHLVVGGQDDRAGALLVVQVECHRTGGQPVADQGGRVLAHP